MDKSDKIIDTTEAKIFLFQKNLEIAKLSETKLKGFKLLSQIKMTERLLRKTGIGRTIHAMAATEDEVGEAAFDLLNKWRKMVAESYMRKQHLCDPQKEEKTKEKQDLSLSDEDKNARRPKKMKFTVKDVGEKTGKIASEDSDDSSKDPSKVILKEKTDVKLKLTDDNRSRASCPSPVLPNLEANPKRNPLARANTGLPILEARSQASSKIRCPTKSRDVTPHSATKKSAMPLPIKPLSTKTKPTTKKVEKETVPSVLKKSLTPKAQLTETKPEIKEIKMRSSDVKSKDKAKRKKSAPIMAKLLRAFKGHR